MRCALREWQTPAATPGFCFLALAAFGRCLNVLNSSRPMKSGIHPAYEEVNVICACGHTFRTRSAHKGDIRVEICSSCHPFFTGKQKLIDTEGRVDRFQKKYQRVKDAAAAKETAKQAVKDAAKKN
jgi:large subunit ribosomal protein L31